ncbi:keratin, type I cytoskeletal 13-like [Pholidichthys leucotaenia]
MSAVSINNVMRSTMSAPGVPLSHSMTFGSVYGGSGGVGDRVSRMSSPKSFPLGTSAGFSSSTGGFNLPDSHVISDNKKVTMQNLNNRLATYLEKVHQLETANAELEQKIRQFLESRTQLEKNKNFSAYNATIKELQDQIYAATRENAALDLAIDNANLAAADFKAKHDNELALRQMVEADVAKLKKVLGDQSVSRADLELQLESLNKEKAELKDNHKEDLLALRSQIGSQVNVEVDAAPQEDLSTVMAKIRQHYEDTTNKNRKDIEAWFQVKTGEVNKEMAGNTETLESSKSEIESLRRTLQTLEIKHQAQISRKGALEMTLEETNSRYSVMLKGFQEQVMALEEKLLQLRDNLENQGHLYTTLLDTKNKLQLEITQYKELLDEESVSSDKAY